MCKRIIKLFSFILTFCMVISESAFAVRYLEVSREDPVVFKDDFSNNNMSDWSVLIDANKKWSLTPYNGSYAMTCTTDETWLFSAITPNIDENLTKNCIISADYTFTERFERSGIVFRATDDQNLYSVNFGIQDGKGIMVINKRQNRDQWRAKVIYQSNPTIGLNKPVNLKVEVIKNTFNVYIDEQLITSYTDNDLPLETGKVGILHTYGHTKIQNVKVTTVEVEEEEESDSYSYRSYPYYKETEIKDFSDAVFDFYGWDDSTNQILYFENNNLIIVPKKGEDFYKNRTVTYSKKKFENEIIEFAAKGEGTEYRISFKNDAVNSLSGEDCDGYNLKVTKNKIILEKWLLGRCTVLGEAEGDFMSESDYKTFKIVPEELDDSLKISVFSDGQEVIAVKDSENYMPGKGYISIVSLLDELLIKASAEKELSMKQMLGLATVILDGGNKAYMNGGIEEVKNLTGKLPLRKFATAFGASVSWNDSDKSIEVKIGDRLLKFMNGYSDYFDNGERKALSLAVAVQNGVTYVPYDVFSEYFNMKIQKLENGLVIMTDKNENTDELIKNEELMNSVLENLK